MSVSERLSETFKQTPPRATARQARPAWTRLVLTLRVLQVRLRFFVVLLVAFVVVGKWDVLRNYWDRLTRGRTAETMHAASADTEYYCPMCPGVLSDWPTKCPVCNMNLVRRKRGEAVPLPNGVLTRMQISPYRLQLAGIRTSPILYQPLVIEVTSVGVVEAEPRRPPGAVAPEVSVQTEVFEKDVPLLAEGQAVEATSEAFAAEAPFTGRVRALAGQLNAESRTLGVWLDLKDPQGRLRSRMALTVRIQVPATAGAAFPKVVAEEWRNRTSIAFLAHALCNPVGADAWAGLEPLLRAAGEQTLLRRGLCLALPESAVIDTGVRKVVYVESAPGMFDGVEVVVGPRCGDFYPVVHGLEAGQRVASTGAFLIDAETQLNRGAAATYFGAARAGEAADTPSVLPAAQTAGLLELTPADRALAVKQSYCPVTNKPLGSMGTPTRMLIGDRIIFLCCAGCEATLKKNPSKYLSKMHEHQPQ
ncbi:MAG TPA: efflux RND transporter periplasmic adaptor subunit [Gemmataceae bacterium]|nr:efflux RND transporter periplasmic adaptor subunit [Gemmataceae bacterium]